MRLNANDSDGKVDKIRCHSYWRQNCKYGLEFKGFCILVIYHTINTKRGEDNYKPYSSISACVTIKTPCISNNQRKYKVTSPINHYSLHCNKHYLYNNSTYLHFSAYFFFIFQVFSCFYATEETESRANQFINMNAFEYSLKF